MDAEHNLEVARRYLAAISSGAADAQVLEFFAPDVRQTEYPNRIADAGATRDLAMLRVAAERGRQVVREQCFTIRHAHAAGDYVFIEALWEGTLAVRAGELRAGDTMRAHCAMVLELREGKIVQQRNYDCFGPFRAAQPAA
jgi:ketosteroid isomerase-like protein